MLLTLEFLVLAKMTNQYVAFLNFPATQEVIGHLLLRDLLMVPVYQEWE